MICVLLTDLVNLGCLIAATTTAAVSTATTPPPTPHHITVTLTVNVTDHMLQVRTRHVVDVLIQQFCVPRCSVSVFILQ